jgi:hypothetical protein
LVCGSCFTLYSSVAAATLLRPAGSEVVLTPDPAGLETFLTRSLKLPEPRSGQHVGLVSGEQHLPLLDFDSLPTEQAHHPVGVVQSSRQPTGGRNPSPRRPTWFKAPKIPKRPLAIFGPAEVAVPCDPHDVSRNSAGRACTMSSAEQKSFGSEHTDHAPANEYFWSLGPPRSVNDFGGDTVSLRRSAIGSDRRLHSEAP